MKDRLMQFCNANGIRAIEVEPFEILNNHLIYDEDYKQLRFSSSIPNASVDAFINFVEGGAQ